MLKLQISSAPEVQKILSLFKFNFAQGLYREHIVESFAPQWGYDYEQNRRGYVDTTVKLVDNAKAVFPISRLLTDEDIAYISKHIDNAYLYVTYDSTYEYEFRCSCDLDTTLTKPLLVELEVVIDSFGNADTFYLSYEPEFANDQRITFWALMQVN